MNLKDRIVLITGGAVRIGRAISLQMAEAGAVVCCHYNSSDEQASELKQVIERKGGQVRLFKADLNNPQNGVRLAQEVYAVYGRIDVLVNNAAIFFKTPFGSVSEEQWDRLMTLNLKSVFFLSQEVAKLMLQRNEGKIINIGDSGAVHPFPSYLPYSISKAGVMALTIGLAKALAPHIQVNCINPGPVLIPETFPDKDKQYAIEQTLLKREGSAEDIARTVRFLIEGSDYITGTCIDVDGGRRIK